MPAAVPCSACQKSACAATPYSVFGYALAHDWLPLCNAAFLPDCWWSRLTRLPLDFTHSPSSRGMPRLQKDFARRSSHWCAGRGVLIASNSCWLRANPLPNVNKEMQSRNAKVSIRSARFECVAFVVTLLPALQLRWLHNFDRVSGCDPPELQCANGRLVESVVHSSLVVPGYVHSCARACHCAAPANRTVLSDRFRGASRRSK
jgi:hypothetical protein